MTRRRPSTRRALWLVGLVAAATTTALPAPAAHAATTAVPVATGLAFPGAFTVLPDGRFLYGERFTGRILLRDPGSGSDLLVWTIPDVATEGEQGLLGLALAPGYPSVRTVFAYVTRTVGGAPENQIVSIHLTQRNVGTGMTVIYRARATSVHNGGRIAFGPDGHLYAAVGQAQNPGNSQNLRNPFGKILRMTSGGGVPDDNPFGNLVWAYGFRNSYGFAFDPLGAQLWATDNGPECNDELNLIRGGHNYGWGPSATCATPPPPPLNTNRDGYRPAPPSAFTVQATAPTGVAFCSMCGVADLEGRLVYGTWIGRQLRVVTLDATRRQAVSDAPVYTHPAGILSVERGPQGQLYFSDPSGIYRLVP